jgi:hypothetical protein
MGRIRGFLGDVRVWKYEHKKELIFALVVFLVASFSFGLGYSANREYSYAPIIIEKCSTSTMVSQ